jgi:hypothetical protein
LSKPTKGLGAQHLKFNLHAGVSPWNEFWTRNQTLRR